MILHVLKTEKYKTLIIVSQRAQAAHEGDINVKIKLIYEKIGRSYLFYVFVLEMLYL